MQASNTLLENVNTSAVLADKAYDTNKLREWLESRGIKAVIPPKSNRKEVVSAIIGIIRSSMPSMHVLQAQALSQNFYAIWKKAINYMGMSSFSSALLWLR